MRVVLIQVERLLLRRSDRSCGAVDVETGILFLGLAACLEVGLAVLNELLLVRELLVEHVGLDRTFATLALPSDGLAAFLGGPAGVVRRVVVRVAHYYLRVLAALHHHVLLLVLHLVDLFLHVLLVAVHRLV